MNEKPAKPTDKEEPQDPGKAQGDAQKKEINSLGEDTPETPQ